MNAKRPEIMEKDRHVQRIPRRTFLGLSGAAAGAALLEGCAKHEVTLVEQSLKRSSTNPGEALWKRSICQQCPAGCELSVRTIDGKAKKIEGDASSARTHGGVCALGHSALQELYHPDRILSPMRRNVEAEAKPVAAAWEEALTELGPALRAAANASALVICCGPDPVERAVVSRIAENWPARVVVVQSPHAAVEQQGWTLAYGEGSIPFYDLSAADFVFAAAASILDRWGNPVAQAHAVAEMQARGGLLFAAGERMSLTAAKADRWLPAVGGLAPLYRALTGLRQLDNVESLTFEQVSNAVNGVPEQIGCSLELVTELAVGLLTARNPRIVVGGEGQTIEDVVAGLELQAACQSTPQALATADMFETSTSAAPTLTLREFCDEVGAGSVQVVLAVGVDLLGTVPSSWGLGPAMAQANSTLVALSSAPDATARAAEWVLPIQTDLERVQVTVGSSAAEEQAPGMLALADPVVSPRGDARHPVDVLLALGESLVAPDDGWTDASSVREDLVVRVAELAGKTAKSALSSARRAGGRLPLRAGLVIEPTWLVAEPETGALGDSMASEPAEPTQRDENGLRVVLFEGVRGERSGWGRGWLNELPDPMSSVMWGSWIELAESDAALADIATGDRVEVVSSAGQLLTTAFVQPAMRPGVAAMPVGGFDPLIEGSGDPRGLVAADDVGGWPAQSFQAAVRKAADSAGAAPIFGRGLTTAEQIPAGWKSHKTKDASSLINLEKRVDRNPNVNVRSES